MFYLCQAALYHALAVLTTISSVESDGQTRSDHFIRQSTSMTYPATHVLSTLSTRSSLRCGTLCQSHDSCLAYTYIKGNNTCTLIDQPLCDSELISNGLNVTECKTFIKAAAGVKSCDDVTAELSSPEPCTDPDYRIYTYTSCFEENHNDVVAYLALIDATILFLNDSTYAYCHDGSVKLFDHRGQLCDEPKALSDIDPEGYFTDGPPDAALENGMSYLLFKGEMLYQYRNDMTKPYISACDSIICWATKTIKGHFGDWAPTHLDAAIRNGTNIYLLKNNLVYTASMTSPVHDIFPSIPCNVTAAGIDEGSSATLYSFRNNDIYDSYIDYDGKTCFR